jgi:hypothetical protein
MTYRCGGRDHEGPTCQPEGRRAHRATPAGTTARRDPRRTRRRTQVLRPPRAHQAPAITRSGVTVFGNGPPPIGVPDRDVGALNRWQRGGLACARCARLFRPDESTTPITAPDGRHRDLRVCQSCRFDLTTLMNRRTKCAHWLCGQCHGGHDCLCVPMPRSGN